MMIRSVTCKLLAIAGIAFVSGLALAQNATTAPAQKTIGQTKGEMVPSLIVMTARGATLQRQTLTLLGVSANSILFADRPVRAAGHTLTTNLLNEWAADNSFGKDPPNATASVLSEDGKSVRDAVVVLKSPKMDGDRVTFDVLVLEGDLTDANGPASLFIDYLRRAFTPINGYRFLD